MERDGVESLDEWHDATPDRRVGQRPERRVGGGYWRHDSPMEWYGVESFDEWHEGSALWRVGQWRERRLGGG